MTINQAHIRVGFEQLTWHDGYYSREKFEQQVLECCARDRKRIDKTKHEEVGINIYGKKALSIGCLMDYFIDIEWARETRGVLSLTKAGKEQYARILTDNYSPSYQRYKEKIEKAFDERRQVRPCLWSIQSAFGKGKPVDAVIKDLLEPNEVGEQSEAYQLSVLKQLGYNENVLEGQQVFQLFPELFLPSGDVDEVVTLEVKGVKKPLNLVVTRPYPNQRYAVAGLLMGRHVTNVGFYPLILPKEAFPDNLELELVWTIGGETYFYTVTHRIELTFSKERDTGDFYSTHQQLVRSSELPEFSLITYTADDAEYLRKRDAQFVETGSWDELLVEKAVLNPFEMGLSAGRSSSVDYRRFQDESKGIAKSE